MKMVKNLAIVAVVSSFMFGNVSFHLANNYTDMSDNTVVATPILTQGDISITLKGGHTFEILEDDTIVYEFKTGPYEGVELDKKFII